MNINRREMIASSIAGSLGMTIKTNSVVADRPKKWEDFINSTDDIIEFCDKKINCKIDNLGAISLRNLWRDRERPLIIGTLYHNNEFLLALYTLLLAEYLPNHKLVICAGSFRRAKSIYDSTVELAEMSNISTDGFFKGTTVCGYKKNNTSVLFMPLGSGDRVRGLRAGQVLGDGFSNLDIESFNIVVAGFAIVKSNPLERVKSDARN